MNSIPSEQQTFQDLLLIAEKRSQRALNTILVVEDEDFVREVTCEVLLSAGYLVLRARTAAEAARLFALNGDKLELLLTDIVLPGRNGQALAHELKALYPRLKTIFISGYPQDQIGTREPLPAGTFYLPKPFSVQMLLDAVETALGQSKTRDDETKMTVVKNA